MKFAELAIRHGTLTWSLTIAVLILGWFAYANLPRLEEPALTNREALVITPFPGASAAQAERMVSELIEQAVLELDQLRRVVSDSSRGFSIVRVVVKDQVDKQALPQVWQALRRKIDDLQPAIPPGAGPSIVDDDLGDVYGLYYALVGEGFSAAERKRVAKTLQQALLGLDGVKKVLLFGERQETIYLDVSKAKTKALGVSLDAIFEALGHKNLPAEAGRIRLGPEHVPIDPSPLYHSERDLGDLMVTGSQDRLIRLGDIAEIRRGYEDPPLRLLRIDGQPAVGIAVSTVTDSDQIALSEAVERLLAELTVRIPLGMELKVVAPQPQTAVESLDGYITSLAQAAAILTVSLLFLMGPRGGLIVGFVTLVAIAGTLTVMDYFQIALQPISIGSLIIALGLISGNAIPMVDGIQARMRQGLAGIEAIREVVALHALPLLGATTVTILAFAPVAGVNSSAEEYTRALFLVMLIALPSGWVAAVTIMPLLAARFLKAKDQAAGQRDNSGGPSHGVYTRILAAAISRRWLVLGATALLLALSLQGFGLVKRSFFPPSTRPSFLVEVYFRTGTHIGETERQMSKLQAYLQGQAGVIQIATAIGAGHPGYPTIDRAAPHVGSHYGLSLVAVDDQRRIDEIGTRILTDLEARFPDALIIQKRHPYALQTTGGRIQLRISGPDPSQLRHMADQVKALIASDPDAKAVRDDWGTKTKVVRPVLAEARARRLRIDRAQIAKALRTAYSGTRAGLYATENGPIPIVVRALEAERDAVEDMADIPVRSPLRGDQVSMQQLVNRLDTLTEDARRTRRDGMPTISVHADAHRGSSFALLERIKPRVEKALGVSPGGSPKQGFAVGFTSDSLGLGDRIPLRDSPGYYLSWGGEAESLAASRARLGARIPLLFGLILLVLIALFSSLRQPLIVLLAAPVSIIGVTAGLLLADQPFGLLPLLAVIGLLGMIIQQAILLVNGIDLEIRATEARLTEIQHAVRARLRPVTVAAVTSILAMLPLLQHGLFRSMAVTLMAGLGVATLLIPILVPVLYATLFRVGIRETG